MWRVISDPEQVWPCIPGCQGIEVTGPATYRARVKTAKSYGEEFATAFREQAEAGE